MGDRVLLHYGTAGRGDPKLSTTSAMILEQKERRRRDRARRRAVAVGFFARYMLRRWQRATRLRQHLRLIFKVAIERWVWHRLVTHCRLYRGVGALVRCIARHTFRTWLCAAAAHKLAEASKKELLERMVAAQNHQREFALRLGLCSWLRYLKGSRALRSSLANSARRGRQYKLAICLRQWRRAARDMTLTLVWTNTSLHQALLGQWKRQVWTRWLSYCRVRRRMRGLVCAMLRLHLRQAFFALFLLPVRHPQRLQVANRSRPRRKVCRCVYDVVRCGRCRCLFTFHLESRIDRCRQLLNEHKECALT